MSTFLFEDMIKINTSKYTCRMWRQSNKEAFGEIATDNLKKQVVLLLDAISPRNSDIKTVASQVAQWAGINSVEITDRQSGDGICVHKDWP